MPHGWLSYSWEKIFFLEKQKTPLWSPEQWVCVLLHRCTSLFNNSALEKPWIAIINSNLWVCLLPLDFILKMGGIKPYFCGWTKRKRLHKKISYFSFIGVDFNSVHPSSLSLSLSPPLFLLNALQNRLLIMKSILNEHFLGNSCITAATATLFEGHRGSVILAEPASGCTNKQRRMQPRQKPALRSCIGAVPSSLKKHNTKQESQGYSGGVVVVQTHSCCTHRRFLHLL